MNFSLKKIHKYCSDHSTEIDPILYELERETNLKTLAPQMMSGHIQGILLQFISQMIRPNRILEIGTFTGYSAICLAKGLSDDGILHTIEVKKEFRKIIEKYFQKANIEDKVKLYIGDAKRIISEFEGQFDLVFIDAAKFDNLNYYKLVIDRIRPGGYILVDNVLWSGKVIDNQKDNDTRMVHAFNTFVKNDNRVENIILPLRDGLSIIRKK